MHSIYFKLTVSARTSGQHSESSSRAASWKHADPNATDVDGCTPLCAASELGRLEVVHCLCDVGAECNQAMTVGRTPLCIASHWGHLEVVRMVRLLCDSGANKIRR